MRLTQVLVLHSHELLCSYFSATDGQAQQALNGQQKAMHTIMFRPRLLEMGYFPHQIAPLQHFSKDVLLNVVKIPEDKLQPVPISLLCNLLSPVQEWGVWGV